MRKLKKGFTIIELVIVIAVIAVLTAVLVPTFVHLSKKARDTNDKSIVTSANIQLAAQESLQGKNRSMSEAVKDVDEIGYHMSTVPTSNGNKIVWDSVTDRFVLLDKDNNPLLSDGEVSSHDKLFYAVSSLDERGDFAVYAKSGYSGTTTFTSETGIFSFDAGDKDDIEAISYSYGDECNVLVATNSADTVLSIDASKGEFTHVGLCGKILIKAVKGDTFTEHGKVGYVKLESGHFVADAGSNIKAIYVSDDAGKVDRLNGGVIESAYGKDNTVTNTGHNVPLDTTGTKNEEQIENQAMTDLDHDINPQEEVVYEISTWAELIVFTEKNERLTGVLNDDISFELFPLEIASDKTLDLNGHSLYLANGTYDSQESLEKGGLIYIPKGSSLIVNDSSGDNSGKIEYRKTLSEAEAEDDKGTMIFVNYGDLTINGGTFPSSLSVLMQWATMSHPILMNFGHAVINDGVFTKKPTFFTTFLNYVFLNGFTFQTISQEHSALCPILELRGGTYTNESTADGIVINYEHTILEKGKGVVLDGSGNPYDPSKVTEHAIDGEYARIGTYTIDPQEYVHGYSEHQDYTQENNYTIEIVDNSWKRTYTIVLNDGIYTLSFEDFPTE